MIGRLWSGSRYLATTVLRLYLVRRTTFQLPLRPIFLILLRLARQAAQKDALTMWSHCHLTRIAFAVRIAMRVLLPHTTRRAIGAQCASATRAWPWAGYTGRRATVLATTLILTMLGMLTGPPHPRHLSASRASRRMQQPGAAWSAEANATTPGW